MSKLSYELTDMLGLLRVVDEAGPISAPDMIGDFIEPVKRGFIGSDGMLTDKGREFLDRHERHDRHEP